MTSGGIRIPCCWKDCTHIGTGLDTFMSHIEKVHRPSEADFGCPECGLVTRDETEIESHMPEVHGKQGRLREARIAFAYFCKNQLIKSDPSLANLPRNAWWQKGNRQYSQPQGRCHECGEVIMPLTQESLLQHYSKSHKIFVDLNFEQLCDRHKRYSFPGETHPGMGIGGMTFDPYDSDDEEESFDDDQDLDDIDESETSNDYDHLSETVSESGHKDWDEDSDEETPQDPTLSQTRMTITQRICEIGQIPDLRSVFLRCVKDTSRARVEAALDIHDVRSFAGKDYLVNRNLPQNVDFDPEQHVCAVLELSGWRCLILHCEARLNDELSMRLHLHAHGTSRKWYCGDLSCRTEFEHRSFQNYSSLEQHLVQFHENSLQSHEAVRQVPRQDVFLTFLLDVLQLYEKGQCDDSAIGTKLDGAGVNFHEESEYDDLTIGTGLDGDGVNLLRNLKLAVDAMGEEDDETALNIESEAWRQYSTSRGFDKYDFEDYSTLPGKSTLSQINRMERIDKLFGKHCCGSHVYLRKPEGGTGLRPLLAPPLLWVEMLTGCIRMDRSDAIRYAYSYWKLCYALSKAEVDQFLRHLETEVDSHQRMPMNHDSDQEPLEQKMIASEKSVFCPWPKCHHKTGSAENTCTHFLTAHLNCIWQCPKDGCEHCGYRTFRLLERHRIGCHVGSPLQCGHASCKQAFLSIVSGRSHFSWGRLRKHYQTVFNMKLEQSHDNRGSDQDETFCDTAPEAKQELLSQSSYEETFTGRSNDFLDREHRQRRNDSNRRLLAKYGFSDDQVQVQGRKFCRGFTINGRNFQCVDSVSLNLETALLFFVPSFMLFTVAPICDYCIHIMSCISRCHAKIPAPFHFLPRDPKGKVKKGSIRTHLAFLEWLSKNWVYVSPKGLQYKEMQKTPEKIFLVDFEFVRRTKKGLPLCPIEVTIRNGNGKVIVSCVINEKGVTNATFKKRMRKLGFDDPLSFKGIRRVRGSQGNVIPPKSMTPKQILDIVIKAGLNPQSFWVEYSTCNIDRHCMLVLIKWAGGDTSILPPPSLCWQVVADLWRSFPDLHSHTLGDVMRIMRPDHPCLKWLHCSRADTKVLYDLLHLWIDVFAKYDERR